MRLYPGAFLAAATFLAVAAPLPVAAHAILMESRPAVGATLAPGPAHIVLRFNSRIDQGRSRMELRGQRLPPTLLKLSSSAGADTLAADTMLAPGAWTLRWQVLAVDGHITRGDVPVTVQAR